MPNADRIRTKMDEVGVTQGQLAAQLGIAQASLSLKLSGKRPFYLREAEQVARILHITEADFGYYFLDSNLHSAN